MSAPLGYPTSCLSMYCGKIDCTGCRFKPALDAYKARAAEVKRARTLPNGTRVDVRMAHSETRPGTIVGTDDGHYHATVNGDVVYLVQFDGAEPDRPGSGWRRQDFEAVRS